LRACDVFADWDVHMAYDAKGLAEYATAVQAVTSRAPRFAPAQYLARVPAAAAAEGVPGEAGAAPRRGAESHLQQGLAADPKSEMGPALRAQLLRTDDWAGRERELRAAVAAQPGSPVANYWLGAMLTETGRTKEALEFTQRSAAGELV